VEFLPSETKVNEKPSQGREKKMDEKKNAKTYVAYGSNMDIEQMSRRCPSAIPIAKGKAKGYRLLFKGSMSGCYATIEPCQGAEVPVLLWDIEPRDERALDRYEGFPSFYRKEIVEVETERGLIKGMAYVMESSRKFGAPDEWYYDVLERAYERFGFDQEILEKALDDSMAEAARAALRRAV